MDALPAYPIVYRIPAGRLLPSQVGGKTRLEADPRRGLLSLTKRNDGCVLVEWRERVGPMQRPASWLEPVRQTDPSPRPAEESLLIQPNSGLFKRLKGTASPCYQLSIGSTSLYYWLQVKLDDEPAWLRCVQALFAPTLQVIEQTPPPLVHTDIKVCSKTLASMDPIPKDGLRLQLDLDLPVAHATSTTLSPSLKRKMSPLNLPGPSPKTKRVSLGDYTQPDKWAARLAAQPELLAKLAPFLPDHVNAPQLPTKDDFVRVLHSPYFKQTVDMLDEVLQSDQYEEVMLQCGLDPRSVPNLHGVEGFFEAIRLKEGKGPSQQGHASSDQNPSSHPNA